MKHIYKMLIIMLLSVVINTNIVSAEEPFYNIKSIKFRDSTVATEGRLYVDLDMINKDETTKITGYFENDDKKIEIQLKDVPSDNPYFELTKDMESGNVYTMTMLKVEDSKDSIIYYLSLDDKDEKTYMNVENRNSVFIKETGDIKKFELAGNSTVETDAKLELNLETTIDVKYITLEISNRKTNKLEDLVYVFDHVDNKYYLDLTKVRILDDGDYCISKIILFNDNGLVGQYSTNGMNMPLTHYVYFTIKDDKRDEKKKTSNVLNSFSIEKTSAKLNENVNFKLDASKEIKSVYIDFLDKDENCRNYTCTMAFYIEDLNEEDAYLRIPFDVKTGAEYELNELELTDINDNKYKYSKNTNYYGYEYLNIDLSLKIENGIDYSNPILLDKLDDVRNNSSFSNINSDEIIIKKSEDSNYEFRVNSKNLDYKKLKKMEIYLSKFLSDVYGENIENEYELSYENLPKNSILKIYDKDIILATNKRNLYLYYYNYDYDSLMYSEKLILAKKNIKYNNDGYYEFNMGDNSKYDAAIISSKKIDDKYVSNILIGSVSIDKSVVNKYIPFVITFMVILIIVIISIIIIKHKKRKRQNEELATIINN